MILSKISPLGNIAKLNLQMILKTQPKQVQQSQNYFTQECGFYKIKNLLRKKIKNILKFIMQRFL